MNIGIDIDDTIADTFDYLMPFVAEFFGADLRELKARGISYSNLPEEWKGREIEFCKKYYDEVVPDTPVKRGAAECIRKIRSAGHRIFIITARDDRLYADAFGTTSLQLAKNHIGYDKLICTFDKAKACLDERIDLFIDDSAENCRKVRDAGIPVLLFRSPVNRYIKTDLERAGSWEEIYERLKNAAD